MPKPPEDPENFDKVNYVIDAWSRPCEAPWYIYIETLKPALLTAFLVLITFGWDDVARGFFRPRGLGRRTGKRKGKRRGRGVPRFPELGELIGGNLPGADEVKGEKWSRLGKTLWRIDGALQAGLFLWLVADVVEDFAFNWTSLLYETVWCQASDLGRFSYSRSDFKATPGGFWQDVQYPDQDYERSPPFWLLSAGNTVTTHCIVAAALNWEPFFGDPPATEVGIRIKNAFSSEVYGQTGPTAPDDDGTMSIPVAATIPPGKVFNVQSWHNAPAMVYTKGFVTAMEIEDV